MALNLAGALSGITFDSYLPSASSSSSSSLSLPSITCTKRHRKVSYGKVCVPPKPLLLHSSSATHICRVTEYKFPDPIPEFADSEIEIFRRHMLKKLVKKETCVDSMDELVGICTNMLFFNRWLISGKLMNDLQQILRTFLHSEYGGPGTLLVIPFIAMADTINEKGLPGGPQAACIAVKWAQDHIDKDWNQWNGE